MNDATSATLAFGITAAALAGYWAWLQWLARRLEAELAARTATAKSPHGNGGTR